MSHMILMKFHCLEVCAYPCYYHNALHLRHFARSLQIENAISGDFVGSSAATVFSAGLENTTNDVIFTITDDATPEPDEIYDISLEVTNGHGVIGSSNKGQITIVANDEAFGVFRFAEVSKKVHVDVEIK